MDYKTSKPKMPEPMPEEMCEQFTRLFKGSGDEYVGERCLLSVLLNRANGKEANDVLDNELHSLPDDHVQRRKMIFGLLGIRLSKPYRTEEQTPKLTLT